MTNLARNPLWGLFFAQLCMLGVILFGESLFPSNGSPSPGPTIEWMRMLCVYLYLLASGAIAAAMYRDYRFVWLQLLPPLGVLVYMMIGGIL